MSSNPGYWRPPSSIVEREASNGSNIATFNRHHNLSLAQQRKLLPIYPYRDTILYLIEEFKTLILIGETGCGKSTQIPQYLMEAGWSQRGLSIVCTQPRRVAAKLVAERVAAELGCSVGESVGYGVSFDFHCSESTQIRYYTDGLLLRETLSDPLLSRYSVIVVDEAHQRSIQSDILLGVLKKILRRRNDLRVIITSATMDAHLMKDFFETRTGTNQNGNNDSAVILSLEGRQFDVDICYLQSPCKDVVQRIIETVVQIHRLEDEGDILIFVPGIDEIDRVLRGLSFAIDDDIARHGSQSTLQHLFSMPLHGSLSHHQQMQVFLRTPQSKRKVVVATNLAETSVTIVGVRFVIDSGLVCLPVHDVCSGLTIMTTGPETEAMARQRTGRAGRTQSGKCFRLFTEVAFENEIVGGESGSLSYRRRFAAEEMLRCDISSAILTLKALAIDDILHFDFVTPPSPPAVIYAFEKLFSLGAIDMQGLLTPRGVQMADLPLDPHWSRCLLASRDEKFDVFDDMLCVAAMCSLEFPFTFPFSINSSSQFREGKAEDRERKLKFRDRSVVIGSDHLTLLGIFQQYRKEVMTGQQQRRGGGRVTVSQSWCDEHGVSHRILYRAEEIRNTLSAIMKRFPVIPEDISASERETTISNSIHSNQSTDRRLRRCLVTGFFANCGRMMSDGVYRSIRGGIRLLPSPATSVLSTFGTPPEWILFGDVTSRHVEGLNNNPEKDISNVQIWARDASVIEPLWLAELAPHYYQLQWESK